MRYMTNSLSESPSRPPHTWSVVHSLPDGTWEVIRSHQTLIAAGEIRDWLGAGLWDGVFLIAPDA